MKIFWCIVFCMVPLFNRCAEETYSNLETQFLTLARTKTVKEIHGWMDASKFTWLHEPDNVLKMGLLFACLPEEMRAKILTENFFHDKGETCKVFESQPYALSLYLLAEYSTKETEATFLKIPADKRFILRNEQIKAFREVAIKYDNNNGKAVYQEGQFAYSDNIAIHLASAIGYPNYPHHVYVNTETMNVLKTISRDVFKEMKMENIRIGCSDDPSISTIKIVRDAFQKSLECSSSLILKWLIDIIAIPYNIWQQKSVAAPIASLFLDATLIYAGHKGYNPYRYHAIRLGLEAMLCAITYNTIPKEKFHILTPSSLFHSYSIYLLATVPLAYEVRKYKKHPNTWVLKKPTEQKKVCTIL